MDDNSVSFVAVGDITLGDHPVCFGHGIRSTIEKNGFDFLFENVTEALSGSDILFGNLETVLTTDTDSKRLDSLEFRGKMSYAKDLARIGFNIMSVANNHAMQHGASAYNDTTRSLETSNIAPIGLSENGESNCSYHICGDTKIATVAYSIRPDSYTKSKLCYAVGDKKTIIDQTRRLKSESCIVILSLHWGEEYLHSPSAEQVCFAHTLIDAGVDLIIGHHPHVIQGVEKYKHGYIAYSLGNFIADFWQEYARKSMIFKCNIDSNGVRDVEIVPIMINPGFQPELPDATIREQLLSELKTFQNDIPICDEANMKTAMSSYYQKAANAYLVYRKECYLYFIRNLYRYSLPTIVFSGVRYIARRLGIG